MKLTLKKTADGSFTLYNSVFGEAYHSMDGAISESMHIYIDNGLKQIDKQALTVFEMGFGTGLNALLTFIYAQANNLIIKYITVEKFPIDYRLMEEYLLPQEISNYRDMFLKLHRVSDDEFVYISENFIFNKNFIDIRDYVFSENIDICYYDAFSYSSQPELWDVSIFRKIYNSMNYGGLLLTYSSKGEVKRALREAGFFLKRFSGYGKKRHNLKALKINE